MNINVNANVYFHSSSLEGKIDKLIKGQEILMSKADDLKAELEQANEVTNEIAADMQDLLGKVGEGSLSAAEADEVKTKINELTTRLRGVAATHTPGS